MSYFFRETAMTTTAQRPQPGPPLAALSVVFTVLFLAGLVLATVLAGGRTYPSPFAPAGEILGYMATSSSSLLVTGFFLFGAAIPLAIFTATATSRLTYIGFRVPGVQIALIGGALSSAFLALSGLFAWTLSRPGVQAAPGAVRALHDLSFLSGGVAHITTFGLLAAGVSVPALLGRLVPRWIAWLGLVVAGIAELSTLSLLVPVLSFLLPLARFPGLVWLIAIGFTLPRSRPRQAATESAASGQ